MPGQLRHIPRKGRFVPMLLAALGAAALVPIVAAGASGPMTAFSENFDSVTAPALPAGWTTTSSGPGAQNWVTSTANTASAPNAASVGEPDQVADNQLTSPSIHLFPGAATLSFRHANAWEYSPFPVCSTGTTGGTAACDGGVLEISVNGGPFTDIVAAGGSFTAGGYTDVISDSWSNPLAGRNAWAGSSAFRTTTVTLPMSGVVRDVQLRWREGLDIGNAGGQGFGWAVDNVSVTNNAIYAGTPGKANCHGKSVSALAQQYGGMAQAAQALGFASVDALQDDIRAYCGS